jgi:hypothetical protein
MDQRVWAEGKRGSRIEGRLPIENDDYSYPILTKGLFLGCLWPGCGRENSLRPSAGGAEHAAGFKNHL